MRNDLLFQRNTRIKGSKNSNHVCTNVLFLACVRNDCICGKKIIEEQSSNKNMNLPARQPDLCRHTLPCKGLRQPCG